MKNKFTTFILFIIMLILLGGVIFLAWAIYNDLYGEDIIETIQTGNTLVAVDEGESSSTEKKSIGDALANLFGSSEEPKNQPTYSSENSNGKYFYEQLNENQKILYNGLQENKENMKSGNYSIQFGDKFTDTLSQENGSEILGDDYQTAVEAYTQDNVDLFYLDVSKLYLNIETNKKTFKTTYNVYISPKEGKTYFGNGFSSELQVQNAFEIIEQKKNNLMAKLTRNTYKDIKLIHDFLVDNVEYDENYESSGTYTIYGALVDNKCVCEGYARAFKYLADSAGIDCVLMQGTATNSDNITERHAWNAVYLEENWYYIDVTWDDPIVIGNGILLASSNYKYFLKGSSFFEKDHNLEKKLSTGGKIFSFPTMSYKDY